MFVHVRSRNVSSRVLAINRRSRRLRDRKCWRRFGGLKPASPGESLICCWTTNGAREKTVCVAWRGNTLTVMQNYFVLSYSDNSCFYSQAKSAEFLQALEEDRYVHAAVYRSSRWNIKFGQDPKCAKQIIHPKCISARCPLY